MLGLTQLVLKALGPLIFFTWKVIKQNYRNADKTL